MKKRDSLRSEAKAFILQYYQETEQSGFEDRWAEIKTADSRNRQLYPYI